MNTAKKVCDIIVPIYNAYEDLVECVDSVLNNTEPDTYRLILIDDQSPDERIQAYFSELEARSLPQLMLLANAENLGFIKTVNKGMQLSETNDVVLLNSDTLVSGGWLSKMCSCAYSDESIATVNPLSNNGALSSVPEMDTYNALPAYYDAVSYGELISRISFNSYPPIPTTCGFCMLIKRSVLNHIGYFDAETYGKGYGEENDFCFRAGVYGYRHAIADDAFVLHKGSKSFQGDREGFVQKHAKLLLERYPFFNPVLSDFVGKNPLDRIQKNVELQQQICSGKRNVLFLLHNDIEKGVVSVLGGSEYYTKDLIASLATDHNCFVMVPSDYAVMVYAYINGRMIPFHFEYRERNHITSFHSPVYRALLEQIIEGFSIDVIHVQHFFKHTLDAAFVARDKNIPCFLTLHDFYMLCPCMHLFSNKGTTCFPLQKPALCEGCLRERLGYGNELLTVWREKMLKALDAVTKIYVPSRTVKEKVIAYTGNDFKVPIEVLEHGFDRERVAGMKGKPHKAFNVAVLGTMAPHKGSSLVAQMAAMNRERHIQLHFFGMEAAGEHLKALPKGKLKQHGPYQRKQLEAMLKAAEIDLVFLASQCIETYSYTLNEAVQVGIPVLGFDIGAVGERITELGIGWTVQPEDTAGQVLKKLQEIHQNREAYRRIQEHIQGLTLPLKQSQIKRIAEDYASAAQTKKWGRHDPAIYYGLYTAYRRADEADRLQELEGILGTVGWRWLQKLKGNKITRKILDIVRPKG